MSNEEQICIQYIIRKLNNSKTSTNFQLKIDLLYEYNKIYTVSVGTTSLE